MEICATLCTCNDHTQGKQQLEKVLTALFFDDHWEFCMYHAAQIRNFQTQAMHAMTANVSFNLSVAVPIYYEVPTSTACMSKRFISCMCVTCIGDTRIITHKTAIVLHKPISLLVL